MEIFIHKDDTVTFCLSHYHRIGLSWNRYLLGNKEHIKNRFLLKHWQAWYGILCGQISLCA